MGEPFLGEIKLVSFNFAPKGWAVCNGQQLPINQNQPLFSLLGTTYGGNGVTTFALPDLRGRVPIHFGNHTLGEAGGAESHTLVATELPVHEHTLNASGISATSANPQDNVLASIANGYAALSNPVAMGANAIGPIGGSQAHSNMQPFLVLNFVIALQGIFPSEN